MWKRKLIESQVRENIFHFLFYFFYATKMKMENIIVIKKVKEAFERGARHEMFWQLFINFKI